MEKRVYDPEKSLQNLERAINDASAATGKPAEQIIRETLEKFSIPADPKAEVEIEVELPPELNALLEEEAKKTGQTKKQLVVNILRSKVVKNDDKVLAPSSRGGSRSMFCTARDNYFTVMHYIATYCDSSAIDIHLPSGRILKITPETTMTAVRAILSSEF